MGKESAKRRSFDIRAERKRKKKVKKLKESYLETKNQEEKKTIIEKIQKVAPYYPIKDILKKDNKK